MRNFEFRRVLKAPCNKVWAAWSEGQSLAQWWGCKGYETLVAGQDFRPGGAFLYALRPLAGGDEVWGKFAYREIVPESKIVFVYSFADPEGNSVRSPIEAHWPMEEHNTMSFDEKDGETTMTLIAQPIDCTDEERVVYEKALDEIYTSFGETIDQLEVFLQAS